MFDSSDNPIFAKATDSGARAPIPASTCGERPSPTKPPSAIRKLVSELGFRYRPSAQADLEAHAAALALLASDLADVPPHLLERAIRKWAVEKPYLPKASELVAICKSFDAPSRARTNENPAELMAKRCAEANRRLIEDGKIGAMQWIVEGGSMRLIDPRHLSQDQRIAA